MFTSCKICCSYEDFPSISSLNDAASCPAITSLCWNTMFTCGDGDSSGGPGEILPSLWNLIVMHSVDTSGNGGLENVNKSEL